MTTDRASEQQIVHEAQLAQRDRATLYVTANKVSLSLAIHEFSHNTV